MRSRETPRPPQKTYGKLAKVGTIWYLVRSAVRQVISVPISMVMARLLTPQEFGIAAAAAFFLTLANRVTELGLNTSLVRVKHLRPEHNSSVFVISLATGATTWLGLTLAAPSIGHFFRSSDVAQAIPISAFCFLITPLSTVPSALLQRNMRFKASSAADWADSLTGGVVAVGLAWAGFGFWSLVYAQVASTTVNVAVKLYLARWMPSLRFSRQALSELFSFGMGIQLKRLLEFGSQNLDNLLVGRLLSLGALGLYDKAFMTSQRLLNLVNLAPGASFRIFSIIQDDDARFRRAYRKVLLTVGVIGVPALAACTVVAPQLFEVLYGKRWLPAVPAFQVLCVATIIKLTSAHATRANEAKGKIWRQVWQHVLYVTCIVMGVWVGSRWGLVGVAFGVLSARLLLAVLIQDLLRSAMKATWREMLAPAVPGLATAGAVSAVVIGTGFAVRAWNPSPPALELLGVQFGVAVLAHGLLIVFSPFSSVRHIVRETLEDFAPRLAVRFYPARSDAIITDVP